jgi:hypothetical protein
MSFIGSIESSCPQSASSLRNDCVEANLPTAVKESTQKASSRSTLGSSNLRLKNQFHAVRHTAQSCARLDALIDSANLRKVDWHSGAEWLDNFGDLNEERVLIPDRRSSASVSRSPAHQTEATRSLACTSNGVPHGILVLSFP